MSQGGKVKSYFKWAQRNGAKWIAKVILTVSIILMISITGFAAVINVLQKGWTADAAAWAQAVGSIVAIAGAAWIARSEAREAVRSRRRQGEEAAWQARFVIVQAQFDAQIIAAELTSDDGFDEFTIKTWRQRTALAVMTLEAMSTRVDHIHAAVLTTICNARVLVGFLSESLESINDAVKNDAVPSGQLIADIVCVHVNLKNLIDQYDARIRGVREALDEGGDMLPIKDW